MLPNGVHHPAILLHSFYVKITYGCHTYLLYWFLISTAGLYAGKNYRSQPAPGIFYLVASNFIQEPTQLLKFLVWSPALLFRSQKKYLHTIVYIYIQLLGASWLGIFLVASNFGGKPATFFRSQLVTMLLFSLVLTLFWLQLATHSSPCRALI